jgi:hypothetical protein
MRSIKRAVVSTSMDCQKPLFVKRSCPSCFATQPQQLFQLSPSQFLDYDYTPELQKRFGIDSNKKFSVVRCGRCSFVYTEYAPSSKFSALIYDVLDSDPKPADPEQTGYLGARWVSQQLRLASALLEQVGNEFGPNTRPAILETQSLGARQLFFTGISSSYAC